ARSFFSVVRTPDPFGILAEKRDRGLQIQHIWLSHLLGFITCALPELKYLTKREHMVCDVLAYPNIPAVVLAKVNANRVRSHDYTCANIAVAEQHPVEERGARVVTHDHVP